MPKPSFDDELKLLSAQISTENNGERSVLSLPDFLSSYGLEFPAANKEDGIPEGFPLPACEIEAIRALHHSGELTEILALDFNVSEDDIEGIVLGRIGPYAGGPIKLNKMASGLHPNVIGPHLNDRHFAAGVLALARELLNPIQFEAFCAFNGLTPHFIKQLDKLAIHEHRPESFERYRDFLRRNAESPKTVRPRFTQRVRKADAE